MKRVLSIGTLFSALCVLPASAILDTNSNGLSDLWERACNGGELFPTDVYPYRPGDDPDGDGWTNEQEADAGTNPFDANPPAGYTRVTFTHIPATYMTSLGGGAPTVLNPEAFVTNWSVLPGKQYTLQCSPDLSPGSWYPVGDPIIATDVDPCLEIAVAPSQIEGGTPDKLFWSVAATDVDSDGDGLTDAEEYELGTDPHNAQTIAGIPDLWLARYFTNILLANGPSAIDPNSDPNNDGYTIAQEAYLNLNPNTSNTPNTGKIGQGTIVNGDFSLPAIGTGLQNNPNDHRWDYWGEGGVTGWSAVVGTHIEFQRIWSKDTGIPYCELKAHPNGHYGIKQQVGTQEGTTYLLMLDCRDRPDVAPSCSNFNVVTGDEIKVIICKISFTDSTGTDPLTKYIAPGAWPPSPCPSQPALPSHGSRSCQSTAWMTPPAVWWIM